MGHAHPGDTSLPMHAAHAEGWFSGVKLDHAPAANELQPALLECLANNFAINGNAFLVGRSGGERAGPGTGLGMGPGMAGALAAM